MPKKFNPKQLHILNVAEELISKNGFKDTSIRDKCSYDFLLFWVKGKNDECPL